MMRAVHMFTAALAVVLVIAGCGRGGNETGASENPGASNGAASDGRKALLVFNGVEKPGELVFSEIGVVKTLEKWMDERGLPPTYGEEVEDGRFNCLAKVGFAQAKGAVPGLNELRCGALLKALYEYSERTGEGEHLFDKLMGKDPKDSKEEMVTKSNTSRKLMWGRLVLTADTKQETRLRESDGMPEEDVRVTCELQEGADVLATFTSQNGKQEISASIPCDELIGRLVASGLAVSRLIESIGTKGGVPLAVRQDLGRASAEPASTVAERIRSGAAAGGVYGAVFKFGR